MQQTTSSTERGQALILIALAAIGLFAIAGLAIDGSAKFSDRRHAQNAADTAALAASLAKIRAEENPLYTAADVKSIMINAARQRADDNGYTGDLVTSQVWVYTCDDIEPTSPSDCGLYLGDGQYLEVVIISHLNTTFARVLGIDQLHNTVRAVAMAQESSTDELYGGDAIVGLAPDQCKTIWFSGDARPNVKGGGVFSNSKLDCGLTIQGSTNITVDTSINMVAGAYTENGNPPLGGIHDGIHGGAKQYPYPPPAWMFPNATCSGSASKSGNSMNPGNWTGAFPPNGVSTLNPGVYCINGNFRLNSGDHLSGTGVTIVMQSGDIDWNGHAEIDLSAPTSGDLAGMLIYAPMNNTNTMRFNGTAATTLTGTIFMPAAPLVYNGTGNLQPSHVQLIAYTIELTGSEVSNILYEDSTNWDSTSPAQLGIMQ